MYAARAASVLKRRETLDTLAQDADDNVREAAVDGLRKLAGHDADAIYVSELTRAGHQILRVSAAALEGTPHPELIGKTFSHGCFRLANWNAYRLAQMVSIGTPVEVVE